MNWKTNWNTWCLGLAAACAFSVAQAGAVSEIAAEKLDFRLIPMVLDEQDIPPQDRAKYSRIELHREQPAEASESETRTFLVSKKVYLTQEDVKDVRVVGNALGQFALNIKFKSASKQKLKNLTQAFLGRQVIMMNPEQGIYYSVAFVRGVMSDGTLELGGGFASLTQAEKIADNIRKQIQFRGVDDGAQIHADFEAVELKSIAAEEEKAFKIWVDKEKIIRPEDMEKLEVRLMEKMDSEDGAELNHLSDGYGNVYYAALHLKEQGWNKLDGFQSAALVGKDNQFIQFIPDYGAETLQLEIFLDDKQRERFLHKIMK